MLFDRVDQEWQLQQISHTPLVVDNERQRKVIDLQLHAADVIGKSFFEAVATGLNELVGGTFTYVAMIHRKTNEVETLALCDRTGVRDNICYDISGTPAERVRKNGLFVVEEGLCTTFPGFFDGLNVTGYFGISLRDAANEPIGNVSVLFEKRIADPGFVNYALQILSKRIQAEVQRLSAEQAIRDQQERLEFALHAGGFGVYDWNTFTNEVVFDDRLYEIIGHTRETLPPSYENWVSIVHPDDYPQLAIPAIRNTKYGKEYYGPSKLRVRNAAGMFRWIQVESYSFYYDAEKNARRNVGIVKDIHQAVANEAQFVEATKQQELLNRKIGEREKRYAFALKVGMLGVYDWYPMENRTILNSILAEMIGRTDEESGMSHEAWLEAVHEDDRHKIVVRVAVDDPASPVVYRLRTASGHYRWVEAHNLAVEVDAEGNVTRVVGILKDIDDEKRSAERLVGSLNNEKLLNAALTAREKALTESQEKLISQMTQLTKLNKELRESEARWAYALEGNGDGVIEWNMVSNELFSSKRAREILGFTIESSLNRAAFLDRIHPDKGELFRNNFNHSLRPPYDGFQMEVQVTDDQENLRWVMFRGKVVETNALNEPLKMVGTVTDLSSHKLFQKEFTIYEEMIKQNQSFILFTSLDGTIEFVNSTAIAKLEYRQHEIIGRNISMLLPDHVIETVLTGDYRNQLAIHCASGRKVITQVVSSAIYHDGEQIGYLFNGIDITEKAKLEEKVTTLTLAKLETELQAQRKQTEMSIQVQENEKQSIARELHDSVGQLLSLAKLQIEQLEADLPETRAAEARRLRDTVQQISLDIRCLTHDLMPLSLRNLGLESALTALLERYHTVNDNRTAIMCKVQLSGYEPDQSTAIHIFRIAQEAINNSIKYSKATSMSLMCMKLKNTLNLIIEDNGVGFDYRRQLGKPNSFGLKTMMERARLIDGKLCITATPNAGTTISLTLPLN